MKLDQLQHLVAIVEHGSLRAASRRLQLPQPALTRSIRALEKELGGAVFLRETTGMVLTAIGRCATPPKKPSCTRRGVRATRLPSTTATMPAPWWRACPSCRTWACCRTRWKPFASVTRACACSWWKACSRTLKARCARSLKALAKGDWAITAVDYNAEDDIARLFESHGLQAPQVLLRARSAMTIMVALAHSDLLAMLPIQWSEFPMTRDTLQVVRIREVLPAPAIVLIRRPDLPLTPAAEFFCDVLRRHGPQE